MDEIFSNNHSGYLIGNITIEKIKYVYENENFDTSFILFDKVSEANEIVAVDNLVLEYGLN